MVIHAIAGNFAQVKVHCFVVSVLEHLNVTGKWIAHLYHQLASYCSAVGQVKRPIHALHMVRRFKGRKAGAGCQEK